MHIYDNTNIHEYISWIHFNLYIYIYIILIYDICILYRSHLAQCCIAECLASFCNESANGTAQEAPKRKRLNVHGMQSMAAIRATALSVPAETCQKLPPGSYLEPPPSNYLQPQLWVQEACHQSAHHLPAENLQLWEKKRVSG